MSHRARSAVMAILTSPTTLRGRHYTTVSLTADRTPDLLLDGSQFARLSWTNMAAASQTSRTSDARSCRSRLGHEFGFGPKQEVKSLIKHFLNISMSWTVSDTDGNKRKLKKRKKVEISMKIYIFWGQNVQKLYISLLLKPSRSFVGYFQRFLGLILTLASRMNS